MSAFSVGRAFDGRLISVVVVAHALLTTTCWRNVSHITQASPPSNDISVRERLLVLVCRGGDGGGVVCA
jgi:hypothetical protein